MILVAGLGNPGSRYAETRHNAGFMVVDRLAGTSAVWKRQFDGSFAWATIAGERAGLIKPSTYVNLSGNSVGQAYRFFKIPVENLVVVHDELDLPWGDVRLKLGGGEAGHKGLLSVSQSLGTPGYGRVRIGIARPTPEFRGSGADYVLQAFPLAARTELESILDRAVDAVNLVVRSGWSSAMNEVNRRTAR